MDKGRLEAFTDGVIAVIITIMVLEMKVPKGADLAALMPVAPVFFAYVLSYINVGLIWNNHHHMLKATEQVDGRVLWANLLLLFWISLVPFVIRWIDESHFAPVPTAAYGVVFVLIAVSYVVLERALIACNGSDSTLARAVRNNWKEKISVALYLAAVGLAFVSAWFAAALYVVTALLWLLPDRRIEGAV